MKDDPVRKYSFKLACSSAVNAVGISGTMIAYAALRGITDLNRLFRDNDVTAMCCLYQIPYVIYLVKHFYDFYTDWCIRSNRAEPDVTEKEVSAVDHGTPDRWRVENVSGLTDLHWPLYRSKPAER